MEDEESGWRPVEHLEMFRRIERLVDAVWDEVHTWPRLAQDTVGKQLITSADSVGSNTVEGDGRFHHRDKLNFLYIARGSCKEAAYWIRRAAARRLLAEERAAMFAQEFEASRRWINSLISQRRTYMKQVREDGAAYDAGDPDDE